MAGVNSVKITEFVSEVEHWEYLSSNLGQDATSQATALADWGIFDQIILFPNRSTLRLVRGSEAGVIEDRCQNFFSRSFESNNRRVLRYREAVQFL
jgi:hypothetical protein